MNADMFKSVMPVIAAAAVLAAPASARPLFDPARPVTFVCTVSGAKSLSPAQVCAVFKRELDRMLARPTRAAAAWPARGNAVRIAVRFASPREVSAAATRRSAGKTTYVPEVTQDVMDKSANLGDLELLAKQVARMIAA